MLLQPRTFQLLQLPDRTPSSAPTSSSAASAAAAAGSHPSARSNNTTAAAATSSNPTTTDFSFFEQPARAHEAAQRQQHARKMLLVHQAGSVKVGEVVRYTLTYTPGQDRVLPTPARLHVRVKNTAAIPLRAAWVHGPYALHVSACPQSFDPHRKLELGGGGGGGAGTAAAGGGGSGDAGVDGEQEEAVGSGSGVPAYEPMVKAGGSWSTTLLVPAAIRETGADLGRRSRGFGPLAGDAGRGAGGEGEGGEGEGDEPGSVTWIIDIASQILFSNSASVGFELLVGRDEKSLELGFAAVAGHHRQGGPGQIKDQQTERGRKEARERDHVQTEGVYSKAVKLVVEDTETLWDKPALPTWADLNKHEKNAGDAGSSAANGGVVEGAEGRSSEDAQPQKRKRKRIHLVVVTHGLHSNIGADMLFLKESIDATVKQARLDAKQRKQGYRASRDDTAKASTNGTSATPGAQDQSDEPQDASTAPLTGGQEDLDNSGYDSDDEEATIVRGFPGNAVRTENGIQYLGKRLAKWILRETYPDQPFLPVKKKLSRTLTDTFRSDANKARRDGPPAHQGSSIHLPAKHDEADERPYKYSSISFVGHSLGGLIQMYAIAYIHKHSPTFFDVIEPINFVALAAPMLGLSNENPMYVKFALDFGLVGRTGQDLGLTWRPPGFTKNSWNSMIGGLGAGSKDKDPQHQDPGSKPLLRILPNGHAHHVLRMFRNRTLYSNVVNDGIVPLRTSCLLFLDWRGLGKVEKARRENGLLGTMAEWGWAELTGANASAIPPNVLAERYGDSDLGEDDDDDEHVRKGEGDTVPQPAEDETAEDNKRSTNRVSYDEDEDADLQKGGESRRSTVNGKQETPGEKGVFDGFLSLFRAKSAEKGSASPPQSKKTTKAVRRGQTVSHGFDEMPEEAARGQEGTTPTTPNPTIRPQMPHTHTGQVRQRPGATRGRSSIQDNLEDVLAPPTTSIFESAGDILHPPLPSLQWITDPSTRKRTIFHDRVYHPEDIPPPPARRGTILSKSFSSDKLSRFSSSSKKSSESSASNPNAGSSGMKVEEKIARDYHRDLSWRKVLVRLEPDAHNNMIVRRMFANAYGWPVIKHLCDTHFADTYSARTRDEEEPARERAKPMDTPIDASTGEEVNGQTDRNSPADRTRSEMREAQDELTDLPAAHTSALGSHSSSAHPQQHSMPTRADSSGRSEWDYDDVLFEGGSDGDDESDIAVDDRNLVQRLLNPHPPQQASGSAAAASSPPGSGHSMTDAHRGLAPISPVSTRSGRSVRSRQSTRSKDSADLHRVVSRPLVEEPGVLASPTSPGSSVGEMGLRRSVEEVVTGTSPTLAKPSPVHRKG